MSWLRHSTPTQVSEVDELLLNLLQQPLPGTQASLGLELVSTPHPWAAVDLWWRDRLYPGPEEYTPHLSPRAVD